MGIPRIAEPVGRDAGRQDGPTDAQVGGRFEHIVGRADVVRECLGIRRESRRLPGRQVDHPVRALERLVEVADARQVGDPGRTKRLRGRRAVEAQHVVVVRQQLAHGVLPEAATAAGDDDLHAFLHRAT